MITAEAARPRLWDAAYRYMVLETTPMAERPGIQKNKNKTKNPPVEVLQR